jgi:16S rRNA (cytidine1402-2'-O)-methyltransferase
LLSSSTLTPLSMATNTGTLYLIPTPFDTLDRESFSWVIPAAARQCMTRLNHYIVEHPKTARQLLKQIDYPAPLQAINIQVLDEHTKPDEISRLLAPLLAGHSVGLLSEAGCPAVADPGAGLVRMAHQKSIRVVPLVGPSSILLALMASGLNGQHFLFHGYLPADIARLATRIREIERESMNRQQTQIFIETPYRNQKLLDNLLRLCHDQSSLCIACNITLVDEFISTRTIREWKQSLPDIHKKPAIFLLHA